MPKFHSKQQIATISAKHTVCLTLTFERGFYNQYTGPILLANMLAGYLRWFTSFCFNPEYGNNYNFHFHGYITTTNISHLARFIAQWRSQCGFVKKSTIGDQGFLGWFIYMQKDVHEMFKYRVTRNSVCQRYAASHLATDITLWIDEEGGWREIDRRYL